MLKTSIKLSVFVAIPLLLRIFIWYSSVLPAWAAVFSTKLPPVLILRTHFSMVTEALVVPPEGGGGGGLFDGGGGGFAGAGGGFSAGGGGFGAGGGVVVQVITVSTELLVALEALSLSANARLVMVSQDASVATFTVRVIVFEDPAARVLVVQRSIFSRAFS